VEDMEPSWAEPTSSEVLSVVGEVDGLPVEKVPIDLLNTSNSLRRFGEDLEHIERLAESEASLPPIVVHRPTMQVLDGMHRLRAATLCGQSDIEVRFFDGNEAEAFVLAVRSNVFHGLPLTLSERKDAMARIICLYPQWSDRMIASATGLAAKTVAGERRRLTDEKQHLDARVGRDGRARPVNAAERRDAAARLFKDNPSISLREVAATVGISPETARRVRIRLLDDSHAVRHPMCTRDEAAATSASKRSVRRARNNGLLRVEDTSCAIEALRADPAFRSNERTRSLLRMLAVYPVLGKESEQLLESIPAHCLEWVATAARLSAQWWQDLADSAERRSADESVAGLAHACRIFALHG
jgi:ParB-like chromosome segregation protein Spo0J